MSGDHSKSHRYLTKRVARRSVARTVLLRFIA